MGYSAIWGDLGEQSRLAYWADILHGEDRKLEPVSSRSVTSELDVEEVLSPGREGRGRRNPRVDAEGLLYHVMARGNDAQKIFLSQSDYQAFIEALRTVRQRYPFSLDAYVLMSNHFH